MPSTVDGVTYGANFILKKSGRLVISVPVGAYAAVSRVVRPPTSVTAVVALPPLAAWRVACILRIASCRDSPCLSSMLSYGITMAVPWPLVRGSLTSLYPASHSSPYLAPAFQTVASSVEGCRLCSWMKRPRYSHL